MREDVYSDVIDRILLFPMVQKKVCEHCIFSQWLNQRCQRAGTWQAIVLPALPKADRGNECAFFVNSMYVIASSTKIDLKEIICNVENNKAFCTTCAANTNVQKGYLTSNTQKITGKKCWKAERTRGQWPSSRFFVFIAFHLFTPSPRSPARHHWA